jgi:rod shape-determining protein MreD
MAYFDDPVPWSQRTREERWDFIVRSWRLAMPTLLLLLMIGIMILPFWLPGPILPQLGFIGMCYWCIRRPDLMHPSVAFIVGLIQDLLMGGALGVEAALFAITCFALNHQMSVFSSRPFHFEWLLIVFIMTAHQILFALLTAMLWQGDVSYLGLTLQGLLSIAIYPLIIWTFAKVQRKVVDRF